MKRSLPAMTIILSLLLILAGCNQKTETSTAVGTTRADVSPIEAGSVVVRPPTRSANSQYEASYYRCDLSLIRLWESADAVAWVSIGNWLSESDYGSYYDAVVVKCYKGTLPSKIVLEQAGTSVKTYTGFPLFTYGNEFLVFLQSWDAEALSFEGPHGDLHFRDDVIPEPSTPDVPAEDEGEDVMPIVDDEVVDEAPPIYYGQGGPFFDFPVRTTSPVESGTAPLPEPTPEPIPEPPYENCYQILSDSAIMDAAVGMDGNVYLLDRYYLVDPYLGFTDSTHRPSAEISEDLQQVLTRRDAYSYRLFSGRILYRLADLLDYLENPPPETEEE